MRMMSKRKPQKDLKGGTRINSMISKEDKTRMTRTMEETSEARIWTTWRKKKRFPRRKKNKLMNMAQTANTNDLIHHLKIKMFKRP